jgi:hypothetical protein
VLAVLTCLRFPMVQLDLVLARANLITERALAKDQRRFRLARSLTRSSLQCSNNLHLPPKIASLIRFLRNPLFRSEEVTANV